MSTHGHPPGPTQWLAPGGCLGKYLWNSPWQRFNLQPWCRAWELNALKLSAGSVLMRVPGPWAADSFSDMGCGCRETQLAQQIRASLSYSMIKARLKVRCLLPWQLSGEGRTSAPSVVFLAQACSPVSYRLREDEATLK